MGNKYNVGDMVRIKKWEDAHKEEGFMRGMKPLCGKPAIITSVTESGIYTLRPMQVEDLSLDWNWHFDEDMFVR